MFGTGKFRIAPRVAAPKHTQKDADWLEYYLELWSFSMRKKGLGKLGHAQQSNIFSGGGRSFDGAADLIADQVQGYEIKTIQACIDSLPREHQLSLEFEYINKRAGANVFTHPLLPSSFIERKNLLALAKLGLKRAIEKRGLVI